MSAPAAVERIVVVHGPSHPDLDDTLRAVGLTPLRHVGQTVVWGPPPADPPSRTESPPPDVPSPAVGAPPILLTLNEVAAALRIGRSSVYDLIGQGRLDTVHIGRSVRVPRAEIERMVAGLAVSACGAGPSRAERRR